MILIVVGAEFCSIPYNSCNLGSINLTTCVENNEFNFDKFKILIQNAIRFLDNMITVNILPLEKISNITKSVRSVGLGVMGLADCLYILKIPYNTLEGNEFEDKLFRFMRKTGIDYSMKLAEEKGVYDEWKGSVWEKDNIKIRNSNLLSIAPTGSISFIADVSGGLEPNFALAYTRRTNEGDIYHMANKYFEQELKNRGIYSEELLKKIAENNGSCQGVFEIPKDMQEVFIVASDITPKQHVDVVGIVQTHVDLSCSKSVNLPNSATIEDVEDIYMYAWELKCKGITIYRDGSRENQILSTISDKKESKVAELEWGTTITASDDLIGKKRKTVTGCGNLHVLAYFDPIDGRLTELYLNKGSDGVCSSWMTSNSRIISMGLRTGVDFEYLIDQLKSTPACPSYVTRTKIKKDTSKGNCCPAAVANALVDMQEEVIDELIEREEYFDDDKENKEDLIDNLKCPECGEKLILECGCRSCANCGFSKCQ